jgi:DNA-binding response OmpR family regulator
MQATDLSGRSILIVEDEPIIALDIAAAFERAGAKVTTTNTLRRATILVESDGLSAAVLDHALGDGDSSHLCERLKARAIPFINYSGMSEVTEHCREAPLVRKPAPPRELVELVAKLLAR